MIMIYQILPKLYLKKNILKDVDNAICCIEKITNFLRFVKFFQSNQKFHIVLVHQSSKNIWLDYIQIRSEDKGSELNYELNTKWRANWNVYS